MITWHFYLASLSFITWGYHSQGPPTFVWQFEKIGLLLKQTEHHLLLLV